MFGENVVCKIRINLRCTLGNAGANSVKQLIVHLWLHAEEGFEVGIVLGLEFLYESLVMAEKWSA